MPRGKSFIYWSYLIEVRGLKLPGGCKLLQTFPVVSYRGTWVETSNGRLSLTQEIVVSYRGTWVETVIERMWLMLPTSYLIEVRGLKRG